MGPNLPIGALVLIAVGVVLLLQTTGAVDWGLWARLWPFWPVILIAIGVNILLGRRAPWLASGIVLLLFLGAIGGAVALSSTNVGRVTSWESFALDGTASAEARVSFGAGSMIVSALPPGSPSLMEGTFRTPGGEADVRLTRSGDRATLRISMPSRRWYRPSTDAEWTIAFARTPRLAIELDGGAADMKLDLRELKVGSLDMDIGAADVDVALPAAAGLTDVAVDAGASDITLIVPEGVAARITRSSGLTSFNVDEARFPKSGAGYETPGYLSAQNRVDIHLNIGAASVTVR